MTKIIPFFKRCRQKMRDRKLESTVARRMMDFYRALACDKRLHTEESRLKVIQAMEKLLEAMDASPTGRMLNALASDMEAVFKEQYQNIFASAPSLPLLRIRYFCGILLELAPFTAVEDLQTKYFALSDFRNVMSIGIEGAVTEWLESDAEAGKIYSDLEEDYPFYERDFSKENMKAVLEEILKKIISIDPTENDSKKKFIWELLKLSEADFRMQFAICDVFGQRIASGYLLPECNEIRGWLPDFLQEDHLL